MSWNGAQAIRQHGGYLLTPFWQSYLTDHTDLKRIKKQRMWEHYHKMRSSQSFRESWITFLKALGCEAIPVFYQFVTDSQLIKLRYRVASVQLADDEVSLDFEESSAVQYGVLQGMW